MTKTSIRGEEIEQAKLIKWSHKVAVRQLMPQLAWLHHSPNGGKRDAFTGAQMKALGVKPGFPDLVLPVAADKHPGMAIEMKSAIGRTSDTQNAWLDHFTGQGWVCRVARTASEARSHLCQYLGMDINQVPEIDG